MKSFNRMIALVIGLLGTILALSWGMSSTPDIGFLVIVIMALVLLITLLFVSFIMEGFQSIYEWLNQNNAIIEDQYAEKAKAHGVDFIDYSVHYEVRRIGIEQHSLFGNRSKGQFVIKGDYVTVGDFAFSADDIRWIGRSPENKYTLTFDLNKDGWWYVLTIDPGYGGKLFIDAVAKMVSDDLTQPIRDNDNAMRTFEPVIADVNHAKTDGTYAKGETVELALSPAYLIVMRQGYVMDTHEIESMTDIQLQKHPNSLNDDLHLLTFTLDDTPFAYASADVGFINHFDTMLESLIHTGTIKRSRLKSNT